MLEYAQSSNWGDTMDLPKIFYKVVKIGPICGMALLYLSSWLLRWTGKWIGGQASPINIRAAMAWSCVPGIWLLLPFIIQLFLFGKELFTSDTPKIDSNPAFISISFAAIYATVGIWEWVVTFKCLGQVQGFSAWKALGNIILASLVIIVPIAIIAIAVS
jgi:hypothetical protein